MYKRPWSLIVLAFFHLIAPIVNVGLNAIYVNRGVSGYFNSAMTMKYFSLNWPIIVAPIICGLAIYACKKWSFFVYLLSLAVLFLFSYQGYLSKSNALGIFPVVMVYAVNIVIVAYFLVPEIREIYFNPRLRWWETKPRYSSDFDCQFIHGEATTKGFIGNFSLGGVFLKAQDLPLDNSLISIQFPFKGKVVEFEGRAILHNRQDSVGFGVEFFHNSQSQKSAKMICKHLEDNNQRIQTRYSRQDGDTFFQWLKILLTTGKGIFPKKNSR